MGKGLVVLALVATLGGCTKQSGNESCSQLTSCGDRAYQFCTTSTSGGCAVGDYVLSDGTKLQCGSCSDCQASAVQVAAWCNGAAITTLDMASDLASDLASSAVDLLSPASSISIPKTGAPYTGTHMDPMLDNANDCPDFSLEPDDGPGQALLFTPVPDQPTAKIIKLAICPTGNNPLTGAHDVDWYKVDNTTGPASLTLMAEIFYDISFGDLDIAIVDDKGHVLSEDGTAVTNGCTAAAIGNGSYYVVVTGANNVDVNKYDLLIRSFAASQTCP